MGAGAGAGAPASASASASASVSSRRARAAWSASSASYRRWRSSVPSSHMQRSAAVLVSRTLCTPNARRAATSCPGEKAPGGRPNSSERATRTAGAVCATTRGAVSSAARNPRASGVSFSAAGLDTATGLWSGGFSDDASSPGAGVDDARARGAFARARRRDARGRRRGDVASAGPRDEASNTMASARGEVTRRGCSKTTTTTTCARETTTRLSRCTHTPRARRRDRSFPSTRGATCGVTPPC